MKFIKSSFSFLALVFIAISYQNCSVYKSDGLKEFEESLSSFNVGDGCLPYMDVNIASNFMQISGVNVLSSIDNQQQTRMCNFTSRTSAPTVTSSINCHITKSAESSIAQKVLLRENLYDPTLSNTDKENLVLNTIMPASGLVLDLYNSQTKEIFGFYYQTAEPSGNQIITYSKFKYLGGKRSGDANQDLLNPCSGGSCAECTISLRNQDLTSLQGQVVQIQNTLKQFVSHIIQRSE